MLRCPNCRSLVVDHQGLLCRVPSCGYKRKLLHARLTFVVTFCTTAFLHVLLIVGLTPDDLWRYCYRGFRDDTALTIVGTAVIAVLWYFVTLCTTGVVWVCIVRPILEWRGEYEPWSEYSDALSSSMKCEGCGYHNRSGSEFCGNCGAEFGSGASELPSEKHPLHIAEARN